MNVKYANGQIFYPLASVVRWSHTINLAHQEQDVLTEVVMTSGRFLTFKFLKWECVREHGQPYKCHIPHPKVHKRKCSISFVNIFC